VAWGKEGKILTAGLTYDNHILYAEAMGVEMVRVPLKSDMSIDLEAIRDAVDDSISLVYICNPNNPTGMTIGGGELRAFCNAVSDRAVVLVDEAYNELTNDPDDTSVLDLVKKGENVIVMRTFSKLFGMAGMRVGYGMAPPELASKVNTHVMAWPNIVGLAAAHASYTDEEFIGFSRSKIVEGREIVIDTFRRNGIEPLPSQTNFVFADIGRNATQFAAEMAEHKVQIHRLYEGYENFSRVSMGRIEDLEIFSRVFDEVYQG
jgi:histidinol-phosphate aminotransferase